MPERACDRINLGATLKTFSVSHHPPGVARIPQYPVLIRHAIELLRVDPAALSLRRCEVKYPLHGTQYADRFEHDARTTGPGA